MIKLDVVRGAQVAVGRIGVLALAAALAACGGGAGGDSTGAEASVSAAEPSTEDTEAAADVTVLSVSAEEQAVGMDAAATESLATVATDAATSTATDTATDTATTTGSATDEAAPTMQIQAVGNTASALTLANLTSTQRVLLNHVSATAACRAAFVPPADLTATAPVAQGGLLTLEAADIAAARTQLTRGPFLARNDYKKGSPDEMARLQRNTSSFVAKGEAAWTASTVASQRATHGSLARDAAFVHLLQPNSQLLAKLRSYLLAQAANPLNDFSTQLCIRNADGSVRDASFGEASWLARYLVTYDAVRASLAAADRLTIENFIRRNAYFLAAQQDYGFQYLFPKRAQGNYAQRASAAAATRDSERWLYQRYDTNNDCWVNSGDSATSFPAYTHVRADGTPGPRVSVLSQWYNNRKSISTLAIGSAGLLLGDSELVLRAKRYVMEWLTYSVYADGSEGEYARNGDYCVANQGLIYSHSNLQAATLLSDMLARRGDSSLLGFSTRDGLFGSESASNQPAKSIELVVAAHLQLATGQLNWYQYRGDLTTQNLAPAQHLGRMETNIFKSAKATDGYHQLGLLLAAKRFPDQPIARVVLRDASYTTLRWPGDNGNAVATGYGSWAGGWTDVMNVYPSALMLRAP